MTLSCLQTIAPQMTATSPCPEPCIICLSEKFLGNVVQYIIEEGRIMAPTLHTLFRIPSYAFKYRDRQSIISDILKVVSRSNKGRKKSQIMQAARLNTFQANRYLELCLRNGYVIVDGIQYKLSGRGLEYLENIEREIIKVQWSQR